MDKEVVVHLYEGILINLNKKQIWVTWAVVDGRTACYVEWSKSQRENQILYANVYMESRKIALVNLFSGEERRHRENVCGHNMGREGKLCWESHIETQYMTICKMLTDS